MFLDVRQLKVTKWKAELDIPYFGCLKHKALSIITGIESAIGKKKCKEYQNDTKLRI